MLQNASRGYGESSTLVDPNPVQSSTSSYHPPIGATSPPTGTRLSSLPNHGLGAGPLRNLDTMGEGNGKENVNVNDNGTNGLLSVGRRGGDMMDHLGNQEENGGTARMSRIGLLPPPPPGPPPSVPPPLPPVSTHPYAAQTSRNSVLSPSSGAFSRAAGKISAVNAFRKPPSASASSSASRVAAAPPPLSIPDEVDRSYRNFPERNGSVSEGQPTSPTSPSNPTISPRSSSLMSPVQISKPQRSSANDTYSIPGTAASSTSSTPLQAQTPTQPGFPQAPPLGPTTSRAQGGSGPRTPSRHLLQTALDLAQRAVEMDKNNDVVGALAAYREAVGRLKSVMERVGVEPSRGDRQDGKQRSVAVAKTDEEGRTLRGIHDAYVARITLLSNYEDTPINWGRNDIGESPSPALLSASTSASASASTSTVTLVPRTHARTESASNTSYSGLESEQGSSSRPSLDDTGVMGIGNLMLGDRSSDRSSTTSSPRAVTQDIRQFDGLPRSHDSFSLQQMLDNPNPNPNQYSNPLPSSSGSSTTVGLGRPISSSPENRPRSSRTGSRDSAQRVSRSSFRQQEEIGLLNSHDKGNIGVRSGGGDDVEMLDSRLNGVDEARSRINSFKAMPPLPGNASPRGSIASFNDDRPLPPLPTSAPTYDSNGGRLLVTPRVASLGVTNLHDDRSASASTSTSPSSSDSTGAFLVSPSTNQGTISQRRQRQIDGGNDRNRNGESISSLAEVTSVPKSDSNRSINHQSSGSGNGATSFRSRAKSETGKRPLLSFKSSTSGSNNGVPPVPTLRQKSSFSMLKINTFPSTELGSASGNTNGNLAPPSSIRPKTLSTSSARSGISVAASGISGGGSLISPLPESQPQQVIQRPFHLLRILYNSMDPEKEGAYLTGAIHISSAVWRPTDWQSTAPSGPSGSGGKGGNNDRQPKIAAQEVKAKVIEVMVARLEEIRDKGMFLIEGRREFEHGRGTGAGAGAGAEGGMARMVDEFCVALDGLEEEMESSYKALVSKGVVLGNWKGKKTSGGGLSWGSRISRSMDKMTNGKNLDSPDRYVDLLSALCYNAQIINEHLENLLGPCTLAYSNLPIQTYEHVHLKITRAAEFVGAVITPFVLDDFKQFFLRYLKSGVRYLEEG